MIDIPKDKLLHLIAGCGVAAVSALIMPLWAAVLMPAVAGAAKELWDWRGNGTVDVWDFVATAAPGLILLV